MTTARQNCRWIVSHEVLTVLEAALARDRFRYWPKVAADELILGDLDRATGLFLTEEHIALARRFGVRALETARRTMTDGLLDRSPTRDSRPWADAVLRLSHVYLPVVLEEGPLLLSDVHDAALWSADWALRDIRENGKGGMWRAAEPFAAAVRLALLAGDVPFAREVLAQEIGGVSEGATERRWLRAIADNPEGHRDGASLRTLFDKLRDPTDRLPGLADLERALVWDLYVTKPGGPVDLRRAAAVYTA